MLSGGRGVQPTRDSRAFSEDPRRRECPPQFLCGILHYYVAPKPDLREYTSGTLFEKAQSFLPFPITGPKTARIPYPLNDWRFQAQQCHAVNYQITFGKTTGRSILGVPRWFHLYYLPIP